MPSTRTTDRLTTLLDAASRRFVAVGIGKTTMEDIAREAGAGKATLYRYFPNKQAVVEGLVRRENDRFLSVLRGAVAAHADAPARIEAGFLAALEFLRSHPMLTKSLAEEPDVLLPYLTLRSGPVALPAMALFAEVVRDGVAAGQLRSVDPEWTAETIFRLIMSFFTLPQLALRLDDPGEVAAYAHAVLAGTLRRTQAPGRQEP
jgi:AcrR family transcriptional regulator